MYCLLENIVVITKLQDVNILILFQPENERQMIVHERTLKNVLTPAYHWLFFIIGRLQHGVKFLVDLRTDVLVNKYQKNLCYK